MTLKIHDKSKNKSFIMHNIFFTLPNAKGVYSHQPGRSWPFQQISFKRKTLLLRQIITTMDIEYRLFRENLGALLGGRLPGLESHMKMLPAFRRNEYTGKPRLQDARKAAVLICFFGAGKGVIKTVLIRRVEYDGVHSGQISFPGGKYEDSDGDLITTALREAEEETGIETEKIEVLGQLSPVYIPPSNFCVLPVAGWFDGTPVLRPEPAEVAEILTADISVFGRKDCLQEITIPHRSMQEITVPAYILGGHIIWGATAMIISELNDILF
jgi:8-oxo-dGTP pyrophosphatase MutT (NUDIX family)